MLVVSLTRIHQPSDILLVVLSSVPCYHSNNKRPKFLFTETAQKLKRWVNFPDLKAFVLYFFLLNYIFIHIHIFFRVANLQQGKCFYFYRIYFFLQFFQLQHNHRKISASSSLTFNPPLRQRTASYSCYGNAKLRIGFVEVTYAKLSQVNRNSFKIY